MKNQFRVIVKGHVKHVMLLTNNMTSFMPRNVTEALHPSQPL